MLTEDFCGGVRLGSYCGGDICGSGEMAGYSCLVELDGLLGMFHGVLGMVDMGTLEGGYHNDMESVLQSETENTIIIKLFNEKQISISPHLAAMKMILEIQSTYTTTAFPSPSMAFVSSRLIVPCFSKTSLTLSKIYSARLNPRLSLRSYSCFPSNRLYFVGMIFKLRKKGLLFGTSQ